jgi:hypothetical protein
VEAIRTKIRRYYLLLNRQSLCGTTTPPEVIMELEDLGRQICAKLSELTRIGEATARTMIVSPQFLGQLCPKLRV